jgi:suppressor for copper-sensitivity B
MGWKMYGPHSTNSGYPPSIEWTKRDNLKSFKFLWPVEETIDFQGIESHGYFNDVLIPIEVETNDPEQDLILTGNISYLVCNQVCVPKSTPFTLIIPKGPQEPSPDAPLFENLEEEDIQKDDIWVMLVFAFVGGFILNFMPCVLPVLSLKVMGLVNKAGDKNLIRISAFTTFIGILTSFLILASISYIFKLSGDVLQWGGQFQNPYFLLFMISIMFFFTANLWSVFEVGQGIVYRIPTVNHKSIIADLWNGFVAVFLATPCSAPFLGTALSFTLTQSPITIFLIFTSMAIGFGLPYILLSIIPPSYIPLPKPGIWMKTFKNILGWGMYGTGIWLTWILLDHITLSSYALMILPILILIRKKILFWIGLILFLASSIILLRLSSPKVGIPFEGETKIQEYITQDKVVIVKITAKWCLSCQLIDHQILSSSAIMNNPKIQIITGDWTKPNSKIESYLKIKNRLGIPLIVIYGPKNKQGIILSEFPSKTEVLNALQAAGM